MGSQRVRHNWATFTFITPAEYCHSSKYPWFQVACQACCCCCCWVASVVSDSVRPQRRQPTRLPRPWDSPGKNTGVGCHFHLQCMKVKSEREVAQSCPTLSDPMDCSPPGSSVYGIIWARLPAVPNKHFWSSLSLGAGNYFTEKEHIQVIFR